jgi:hypothetical protein
MYATECWPAGTQPLESYVAFNKDDVITYSPGIPGTSCPGGWEPKQEGMDRFNNTIVKCCPE